MRRRRAQRTESIATAMGHATTKPATCDGTGGELARVRFSRQQRSRSSWLSRAFPFRVARCGEGPAVFQHCRTPLARELLGHR
jgi:hypothetical protein